MLCCEARYVGDRVKKRWTSDTFVADIKRKQKNVTWPDPLVNSRGVDQFFWRGSRNPTVVQRFAAWLFGLVFMIAGLAFLNLVVLAGRASLDRVVLAIFSLGCLALGARTFRNGFPRRGPDT